MCWSVITSPGLDGTVNLECPYLEEADSSRHVYSEFTCFAAVGLELGQPCLCTEWMWELLVNSGLLHSLSHCSGCLGLACFIYFWGGRGWGIVL